MFTAGTAAAGIESEILQQRLQVGLGIASGTRGSLHKCQTSLLQGSSHTALADVRLAQLELNHLYHRVKRQEKECSAIAMEEDEPLSSNEGLRRQLHEVQAIHQAYLEYEALATDSTTRTSTATLQDEYDQLMREKEALQRQLHGVQEKLYTVQSQYHLLQQCLQDLKQEP
jgi:FtsZ-binding cell division protein ZapB